MDLHPRNNLLWLMIRTKKTIEENVKGLQAAVDLAAESGHLPFKNPGAKRRPHKATKSQKNLEKEAELEKNDLFLGQCLSADHYQSAVPGRTYGSRGSYHPEDMFNGGTIFVGHASGKIFIYHQQSLSATNSIKSMLRLKREAAES
eukprot:13130593-Ditylum_brightwellii.AAC.1